MNIKNFDLNLLLVFRTVFEEKNVTKASKKLGIRAAFLLFRECSNCT